MHLDNTKAAEQQLVSKKAVATIPPSRRSEGSTYAAIMVLASMMRENRIEEAGGIAHMDAENHLIKTQTDEMKALQAQKAVSSDKLGTKGSYEDLQVSVTCLLNRKDVTQENLATTTTLHLRNPSETNEALASLGSSYDRVYKQYAETRN